jgi:hypothetical protein
MLRQHADDLTRRQAARDAASGGLQHPGGVERGPAPGAKTRSERHAPQALAGRIHQGTVPEPA